VLGRASCFDDFADFCGTGPEVHRSFFHQFCKKFVARYKEQFIKPPISDHEIDKTLKVYEKIGFPGCIGSMDCTHIPWDRCPS
jgi:hypothetical protein